MSKGRQIIHIVAGPTASGKSAKAITLAEELGGVIINCDSVQIYDGLPILTAQPSEEDKARVPHRLYAHLHPNDICSAGDWRELAKPLIEEVLEKGQAPIICGGSGLYIKALTDGLSPMPDIPDEIREAAVQTQKALGNPGFHEALQKRDPVMATRLHPQNTARLIRAWEVLEATGKSIAGWQQEDRLAPPDHWDFEIHKVMPEREDLYNRCNARFLTMLENGAIEEVAAFQDKIEDGTYTPGTPITKALGYKSLLAYSRGKLSKDEAITHSQGETRRYAKRQVTWFRHQL